MMQATDLRLTFNPGTPIENPALRGINLNIANGEFVTVIGTNGAGKSTFLNAVSGTHVSIVAQSYSMVSMSLKKQHISALIGLLVCFKTQWLALVSRSPLKKTWHWLINVVVNAD